MTQPGSIAENSLMDIDWDVLGEQPAKELTPLERLAGGLLIESPGITLPWYADTRSVRGLLGLEDHRLDKETHVWKGLTCLNGLESDLYLRFIREESGDGPTGPRQLRFIEFRTAHTAGGSVEQRYRRGKAHLKSLFGEPGLEYDGQEGALRSFCEWETDEVLVVWKIVKGDAEDCVGELWRKPLPKQYLKLTLTSF